MYQVVSEAFQVIYYVASVYCVDPSLQGGKLVFLHLERITHLGEGGLCGVLFTLFNSEKGTLQLNVLLNIGILTLFIPGTQLKLKE